VTFFAVSNVGADLSADRHWFKVESGSSRVGGGGVSRVDAAAIGRFQWGAFELDPLAGYSFSELPSFGDPEAPGFSTGQRHAVLLAARASWRAARKVAFELEPRLLLPFSTTDTSGEIALSSSGYGARAGAVIALSDLGGSTLSLVAGVAVAVNQASFPSRSFEQLEVRPGLALELTFADEPPPTPPAPSPPWREPPAKGALTVRVTDPTGAPLPDAQVTVQGVNYLTNRTGTVSLVDLKPGPVSISVLAENHAPVTQTADVTAGISSEVVVVVGGEPR